MITRRQLAGSLGGIALAITAVGFTPAAEAATPAAAGSGSTVDVTIPASGPFTVSQSTHQAGPVRFHFVSHSRLTQDAGGSDIALVGLRNGVSLTAVANHIRQQQNDPSSAAASTRWLVANTRLYGGAAIGGVGVANATAFLPAGTVYLLDVDSVFGGGTVYSQPFHVTGTAPRTLFPPIAGTINVTSSDQFDVSSPELAQGNYLVRNVSDTIHFVDVQPVKPGTTDADITAVATAEMNGQPPSSDPYLHDKTSVEADVLSPGQQEVVSSPLLTPGTYDLECYIADDMTGVPHFFMGMHKIIVIK